ncbi:MAG TPA: Ig-like domain-containing protein [Candidatus Acidoferrales bacterium]|nr:Ig-like domain-containing protein [Candidatus Acidoferrales bacterium]
MKTNLRTKLLVAGTLLSLLTWRSLATDLLARYPTQLKTGDALASHARPWQFSPDDIFRVTQFEFKVGDKLKVETQEADLGIGHCSDGAVWAVLLPRSEGTLTSPQAGEGEPIANIWFRFHPGQINRLFPPETVFADGDKSLVAKIRGVVNAKFGTSWHAGMNAMIPDPKDITVFVDTKGGARRFFMVNDDAKTAEYVGAFNQQSSSPGSSAAINLDSLAPVVVKTVPEAGSKDVPPGEFEVKITFSKEMADGSWSWCTAWENSTPEGIGDIHYDTDHKTCILKVKLEAGKTYGWWINSQSHHNFQDSQHHPAIPYLLTFRVRDH